MDLKHFSDEYNFYIKKTDNFKINTDVIKITDSVYEKYYHVVIDEKLYNRFCKLHKFKKTEKSTKLFNLINFCFNNSISFEGVITNELAEELSSEISKQIIKELKEDVYKNFLKK